MPETDQKNSVLFLDKVLTKPLKEPRLRGVEVFNVFFIKDLLKLGHEVTLILHSSWVEMIEKEIQNAEGLNILVSSKLGGKHVGSLGPLWKIRNEKFDALFLANVGDGILVPYRFILFFKMAKVVTLLAHKVPGQFFVNSLAPDTRVVSVNRTISRPFEEANKFPVTDVYYGILNTDQLYPPSEGRENRDGPAKFGMLGDLDSDWKGSDTAIEAFSKLPPEIRENAELHLAAFSKNPPQNPGPGVVVHEWIDRDSVGDFLRSLDIMLVLSREINNQMMETFCQTMVQGMLCELPQITTELEIFEEKLTEGGGIPTKGMDQLVEAMIKFASNPEERWAQGKIAAKVAADRYVWNSQRFVEHYF